LPKADLNRANSNQDRAGRIAGIIIKGQQRPVNGIRGAMVIDFRPMEREDLSRMRRWLNTPHVREWYSEEPRTLDQVEAHYLTRINGEDPTRPFIILCDSTPIGYIQSYRIADYPDYARYVAVEEDAAGVDLLIGEVAYVHRGLGSAILRQFLRARVFGEMSVVSCLIGPQPKNAIAIRAYEKAGFRYLKTIKVPDEPEPEHLMRIGREDVMKDASSSGRD
jgi:RimJ/RimL family protein N-acetyltransferase